MGIALHALAYHSVMLDLGLVSIISFGSNVRVQY